MIAGDLLGCRFVGEHQWEQRPRFPFRCSASHLLKVGVRAGGVDVGGEWLGDVAPGQPCVGDDHSLDEIWLLGGEPHADDPAPVVQHEGALREHQLIDEQTPHPLDVALDRVVVEL